MSVDFGGEINKIVDAFLIWLPRLLEAIIIWIIGWIIALALKAVVIAALKKVGFNRIAHDSPEDTFVRKLTDNPSETIGGFVYWLIMIITITMVIAALNIPILTDLVNRIYSYIPNILAAIVILLISLALSSGASGLILRWMGDTPTGKITATVIPVIIMSITGFAILEQLNIAPVIITTTYIALIGSFFLALALAFGLGGRDIASRLLNTAYEKGSITVGQVKADIEKGKIRAQEDVKTAKKKYNNSRNNSK